MRSAFANGWRRLRGNASDRSRPFLTVRLGRLRWRPALANGWRCRVASSTIAAINAFRPITRLRRARLGLTAVLRTGASTITLSSAALIALAAPAPVTLARATTTIFLAAAAVSRRALTLGGAFRRVDESGRKHHSRRDEP